MVGSFSGVSRRAPGPTKIHEPSRVRPANNSVENVINVKLKRCAILAGVMAWLLSSLGWAAPEPQFTAEEKTWIAAHPTVRTYVDPDWRPFEFREHGKAVGIVPSYLDAVSRISGLRFEYVESVAWPNAYSALLSGDIDMVPDVSASADSSRYRNTTSLSRPYFVGTVVVVAPASLNLFTDFESLAGRRIAIKRGGALEYAIRNSGVPVTLLSYNNEYSALAAVADGKADVAIGPDMSILPLVRRQFQGELFLSGGLPDRPYALSLATRRDNPILASILDKSIAAIPARDTESIPRGWLQSADYGKPTFQSILYYHRWQVATGCALLFALVSIAVGSWRARAAAIGSAREKAMFFAFISHEIRTPMHTILSSLELLQRAKLAPKQASQADAAVAASESLLTLLDDILDYSRLESRNVALVLEPTQVGPWIRDSVEMVRWRIDEKHLDFSLELECAAELCLLIDPVRTRQIVLNLLVNAIKFTSTGSVEVHVDYLEGNPESGGSLLLEVRDTGVGIPSERQRYIFEPYRRVEEPGGRRVTGSGLGLSICRELVDLMKGEITVDSSSDKGTVFTVILPARRVRATPKPGTTMPATPGTPSLPRVASPLAVEAPVRSAKGPMILVVDDHEAVQHAIEHQLEALGCRSAVAANGGQALERFECAHYDMVLLDCDLPDIDGYTVAQRMRASEQRRERSRTPIIAISASTDGAHSERCFDNGMDGVLSKPLRLDALLQIIDLWCPTLDLERCTAPTTPSQSVHSDFRKTYLHCVDADLDALGDALSAGDSARALHAAHRIKGAASIAGHSATSELASKIERRLQASSGGIAPDVYALYDVLSHQHRTDVDNRAADERRLGDASA